MIKMGIGDELVGEIQYDSVKFIKYAITNIPDYQELKKVFDSEEGSAKLEFAWEKRTAPTVVFPGKCPNFIKLIPVHNYNYKTIEVISNCSSSDSIAKIVEYLLPIFKKFDEENSDSAYNVHPRVIIPPSYERKLKKIGVGLGLKCIKICDDFC